jgi:hypothetical protein
MKRSNLLIGIAIFTFSIGVAVAWSWSSFSQLLTKETVSTSTLPKLPAKPLSEEVQIKFLSSEKRNAPEYVFAIFQITNGSSETLYYKGYSKDSHCSYKIKRDNIVEPQKLVCNCGMGLEERALLPGETATYDIGILVKPKANKIQVEFDFGVGGERRKETIWTDEFIISK